MLNSKCGYMTCKWQWCFKYTFGETVKAIKSYINIGFMQTDIEQETVLEGKFSTHALWALQRSLKLQFREDKGKGK
jgi:hypothetical protein